MAEEQERTIKINYNAQTGAWSWQTTGFNVDKNFSDYEVVMPYGNQLINGRLKVIDHNGKETIMEDGGHLLQYHLGGTDPEKWPLEVKSDADYEKFTGRPGSKDED